MESAKKKDRSYQVIPTVMRYLAVVSALMIFYPVVLASETFLSGQTDLKVILLRFSVLLGCGFLGFFASMLFAWVKEKWNVPVAVLNIISIVSIALGGLAAYACCGFDITAPSAGGGAILDLRVVIMILLGMVVYLMGNIFYYRPYPQINTTTTLAWACGLHVAAILVVILISFVYNDLNAVMADAPEGEQIAKEFVVTGMQIGIMDASSIAYMMENGFTYSLSSFIPEFLLYIASFVVIRNQANIDRLMQRRKHKMEDLPKWVRTYNLGLTSIIMAIVCVLYLCKDWIITGIKWLSNIVGIAIFYVLMWVGNLFVPDSDIEFMDAVEEVVEEGEYVDMSATPGNNLTMFVGMFLVVLLIFGFIWLCIRFRVFHKIWNFLKSTGIALLHQIRHGKAPERKKDLGDQEYVDSETELGQDDRKRKKREDASAFKYWRQQYKQFLKLKDEAERYEKGYLLLTDYFKLRGIPLLDGDTANQINFKAIKSKKIEAFSGNAITEGYHLLCYADKGCNKEKLTVLEQALHRAYVDCRSLKVVGA